MGPLEIGHDTQVTQVSLRLAWSHGPPHLPGSPIRWHTRRLNRRLALNPYECHPRAAHATVHMLRPHARFLTAYGPIARPFARGATATSPRVPPGDDATIPGLGGGDGYSSRWRRAAPTVFSPPWYLVIVARNSSCDTTSLSLGPEAAFAHRLVSPSEAAWIGVGMACTAGRTFSAKRRRLFSAFWRGMPP